MSASKKTPAKAPAKAETKKVVVQEAPAPVTEVVTPEALDPATAVVVEPPVESVAKVAKETPDEKPLSVVAEVVAKNYPNADKNVLFVSTNKDLNVTIYAGGKAFKPTLDETKTVLVWTVDPKIAPDFAKHTLVQYGKIIQALGK